MEITKEQVDDFSFLLKINLKPEDYLPAFNKGLKDARKKMSLKGFRQGMVPISLVKKYVGNGLLGEKLQELINEQLANYLSDNEMATIAEPLLRGDGLHIDYKVEKEYDIEFEVAPLPEVAFPIVDNPEDYDFTDYRVVLTEEELKEELEKMRLRLGEYKEVDEVEGEKDDLNVTIIELNEEGEPKEEGIDSTFDLPIDFFKEDVQQTIIGLGKESKFESKLFEDLDKNESEIINLVLNSEKPREEIGDRFQLTINKISRMAPADLDKDFYDKVFPDGEIITADEFMPKLREKIEKEYVDISEANLLAFFTDAFFETSAVTMPQEFLERLYAARSEEYQKLSDKEKKSVLKSLTFSTRKQVIIERVRKKLDIEVEDYEIIDKALGITADETKRMYGVHLPYNVIEKYAMNRLEKDREFLQLVTENVVIDNVYEALRDRLNITEKEVSLTELTEIIKNINEEQRLKFAEEEE